MEMVFSRGGKKIVKRMVKSRKRFYNEIMLRKKEKKRKKGMKEISSYFEMIFEKHKKNFGEHNLSNF